jgi:hypothetical protein
MLALRPLQPMSESSAQRTRSRATIAPRLLTRRQAAEYCGVSVETFAVHCPVRPIAIGPGKRLERFDVTALDRWIDLLNDRRTGSSRDWLAALEDEDDGRTH